MNRSRSSGVTALLSVLLLSFFCASCVEEEYDMSEGNLNLEVTPFVDGLTIPLGSTEKIQLKELFKDVDDDILSTGENGAYSIRLNDSFDMTEQLSSLTGLVKIPDVDFSQNVSFRLDDVDVSDVRVEARDYAFGYEFSSSVDIPEITIPAIAESFEIAAGMAGYVPDPSELQIDFGSVSHEDHFMSISDDLHIPADQINDIPIPLEGDFLGDHLITDNEFEMHGMVPLKISLPKGITSVEDIVLHEGAGVKVTLALKGNFLHSGKLIPKIDIDLHNIFHLEESYGGDVAHLAEDFILSEENGYSQTKTYGIASVAITKDDWVRKDADGELVLDKTFEIPAAGEIIFKDLMTTTRHIEYDRSIDLLFTVEFINLQIDDVVMNIDPIEISYADELAMSMSNIDIPEYVEEIRNVTFTNDSGIDIVVKARNLDKVEGLEAELETLEISFPKELKVEGADAANKVVVSDVDLSKGVTRHINITGVDLPTPAAGKITFDKDIEVKAVAKAGGKVHSADLPAKAADDVKVVVDIESSLEVADYQVKMNKYDYKLDVGSEVFKVEIPEAVADMSEITIYPEGSPVIKIDFDLPELALDVVPAAEGLSISFPQILRFKDLPSSYNYDPAANSITLKGSFPAELALPVEKLVLVPVQDKTDGKWYAEGEVNVTGGVSLASGVLDKADIESLTAPGKMISVVAHVPEIVPSALALDTFETSIREEFVLDILSAKDVPAELVSLGVIEFDDNVEMNISLDASALPDVGSAALSVDLVVDLPDMIKVEGADDAAGNITVAGKLDDKGMIVIDPVKIKALDFTGMDNISNGIKDVLVVDGTVTLSNASIDIDRWLGRSFEIGFNAGIKDIEIARVTGMVDYKVDPVVEYVDLSDFTAALGDMGADANFDFCHAHLGLDVTSNLGVPVKAEVELIPYYDGKADASKIVPATLTIDPAASADEEKVSKLWLAINEDRMPEEYTFVKADILSIINDMPEKLEFRLNAATDPERESVLEPAAEYKLSAAYTFELPLEFGEEFEITYKTEIHEIPAILGSLLSQGTKVKLAGEIVNSIPLGLDLRFNFFDKNGNVVPLAEGCGVQKIYPCNLESASKTPLDIVLALKEGTSAEIASLELEFNANAADVAGIPVKEDAYLQAVLQLVLPEGLTIDLSEIIDDDK
ncbi:MAG: hypothetical protein IJ971_00630 [Bacteroidales bacterium]|nr:hypothetical protein [Bacteroidales bacterium]